MYKVFIDTSSFINSGLNFDPEENNTIKSLIKYSKRDIKIIMISIIKNEILKHLLDKEKEEIDKVRKCLADVKWLNEYITEEIINQKASLKTNKFEDFLEAAQVKVEEIDDVSPQIVFDDYFNCKLPFEDKKTKKNEFPDAFISHKIKNIIEKSPKSQYILIAADNGLRDSLLECKNVIFFTKIQEMLTLLSKVGSETKDKICSFLEEDRYETILNELQSKVAFLYDEDEYLEFDVDFLQIESMYEFDIIDYDEEKCEYIMGSDISLQICGNFIKRNFKNSLYDNERDEFIYEEFDNLCGISIPSIYIEVKITMKGEEIIYNGINYCDDLLIDRARRFEYIEKNVSPNRLNNLIAVWE